MELNKINSSGNWGKAADDLNQNFSKVNNAVEQVKNATTRNKGYFSSEAALKSAFKSASFGDIAYVGSAFPYQTWAWNGSEWVKKNDNGGQESVNLGNYYTKSETDGKFTETDAKLSELGSKINTLDIQELTISVQETGYWRENSNNNTPILVEHQSKNTSYIIEQEGVYILEMCNNSSRMSFVTDENDKILYTFPNASTMGEPIFVAYYCYPNQKLYISSFITVDIKLKHISSMTNAFDAKIVDKINGLLEKIKYSIFDKSSLLDGYYYNTNGEIVSDNPIRNDSYSCSVFNVYKGDIVSLNGLGYTSSGTSLYCITDVDRVPIIRSGTSGKISDEIIIEEDGYVYVNPFKSDDSFSLSIKGNPLSDRFYIVYESIEKLQKRNSKLEEEVDNALIVTNALTPFREEVAHTASSNWKNVYNNIPKGFTAIININSISISGAILYTTHDVESSSTMTGKGLLIVDNVKKLSIAANKSTSDWESGISYNIMWDIMVIPSSYMNSEKTVITSSQFEKNGNYYGTEDKKWVYHKSYTRFKPVFLQKGAIIQYRITVSNNTTSSFFKVDAEGNIVEKLITADGTSNISEGTLVIEEDGLYVFSYVNGSVYINTNKYLSSEYGKLMLQKKDETSNNDSLVTNGGELAIFKSVAVCGDSLSSGEMAYGGSVNEGTTKYRDMYEYSWLQFLARKAGFEASNFSVGGLSAKTFFTTSNSKVREFDTKYCQAYFIALGHNDLNYCKSNYASLGFSSLDEYLPIYIGSVSDIDLNNYNNNADTFYGNYAKIIQSIKEKVPNAKIFPIVMKSSYYNAFNVAIKKMAELFDNIYIVDMQKYFPDIPSWHYTEGHGNAMGYKAYGDEIATVVDRIIKNNRDYFKYTSLIGTDLSGYIPDLESTSVPTE